MFTFDQNRDPGSQYSDKVKMLVYLNDVGPQNGPFTIIPNSRKADFDASAGVRQDAKGCHKGLRFYDEYIDLIASTGMKPIELTGQAGDLILADVGNIHRGKPIEEGVRYSLTNYYQRNKKTSDAYRNRMKKFSVFPQIQK